VLRRGAWPYRSAAGDHEHQTENGELTTLPSEFDLEREVAEHRHVLLTGERRGHLERLGFPGGHVVLLVVLAPDARSRGQGFRLGVVGGTD
jgi:hypothetical protein